MNVNKVFADLRKYINYTGCLKSPGTVGYFLGKIFFKKVKVIPEVNFIVEFNGDFHFDLEVDLHGFFKVKFVFLNGNPLFSHLQSIERKILRSDTYPSHRSSSRSVKGYLKLTKFSKRSVYFLK